MKSCVILLNLVILSSGCWGASLENTSRNEDSSPRFPCPLPEYITPCVCIEDANGLTLDCSAVQSNAQLADVFKIDFPVKQFYEFRIDNNDAVTVLGHGLNNVTFERIYVVHSNVDTITDIFILETARTLRYIYLSYTMLTENSIAWSVLEDVPNLEYFRLTYSDGFTWIPPFSSQSLTFITFNGNSITSLDPGTFDGMPKLGQLYLQANQLTFIKSNSITVTPLLTNINLPFNLISTVDPNAFVVQDTVTEAYLNIYLYSNFIEELREDSFGNVFPYLEMLYIYDNPLKCECEIAWIITNPAFISKIDPDATCKNGTNLHDLNPAVYEQYCPL